MQTITQDNFTISRVIDGDTIEVVIDGWPPVVGYLISVRIRGMDCPEIRTRNTHERALGIQARDYLRYKLLMADNVELRNVGRGKYFRLVADVFVDGYSAKRLMFLAGHAVRASKTSAKHDWSKVTV